MTTTTTFPGIYIEEIGNLPLSIASGATAVPAIATSDLSFTEPVRVNSWLDFISTREKFDVTNKLHVALRTYFENGGGYCHVVSLNRLEQDVPKLDDVTLLVAAGEDIKTAVNALCIDGASRFAILDGPETAPDAIDMGNYDANKYAAVYYPWLNAAWAVEAEAEAQVVTRSRAAARHKPAAAGDPIAIPPSAAVAGAYCSTDRERGVWKAPANILLRGGLKPKFKISNDTQGQHNGEKALNMLREFGDSGLLVWGARTLDNTDDWRYVPVRRLFSSAEKDIKRAMRPMVFEPNSQPTWERVRGAVDNYLRSLWRQGALLGNSEKEAYFVKIGLNVSMTEADIAGGKMIVQVGMAAVRPAEFIILQFTQDMGTA